jgi:hypothetical protein
MRTMEQITCRHCGEKIAVSSLDLPVGYREDAADALHPRQFVIYGDSSWLLHRCEIADDAMPGFED